MAKEVCEMCSRFFPLNRMFKFFTKRFCLECSEVLFMRLSRYIDEERRLIEEKELFNFNQLNMFNGMKNEEQKVI